MASLGLAVALLFTALCSGASKDGKTKELSSCPTMRPPPRSQAGKATELRLISRVPRPVQLFWVSPSSEEEAIGSLSEDEERLQNTYAGHHFRFYMDMDGKRTFIGEYVVSRGVEKQQFVMYDCDPTKKEAKDKISGHPRSEEFELLVHSGLQGIVQTEAKDSTVAQALPRCEPTEDSSKWSCVRLVPADLCKLRHKNQGAESILEGHKFGFTHRNGGRQVGETDAGTHSWGQHAPVFTNEGFLKMNMTNKMKDFLLPWFEHMLKAGQVTEASPVGGGYMNDNVHKANFVNLDQHRHIQRKVASEMQDVLEWYSGTKLQHQATFGVRIYQRGNVLLNHKDRGDTHIASAVLQVSQSVDEDGGWPLEVHPVNFGDCYEVYLQPGEMVLYEGARLTHGRPMRLQGEYFANIFSHFRPESWNRKEL